MPFPIVSFFAEVDSISFWPKSLDYSKAFCSYSLRTHNSALELKFAPFFPLQKGGGRRRGGGLPCGAHRDSSVLMLKPSTMWFLGSSTTELSEPFV